MKIIFPEVATNPIAIEAIKSFPDIDFLPATSLDEAAKQLASGTADSMLSGLDYPSRDVLIAYRDHLPLKSDYFSSCFICQKDDTVFALADGGVNKLPTKEQLYTTVKDTAITFSTYTGEIPRIAMLSYSTHGSGGKNPDLEKIHYVITQIRQNYPDWPIDGEMQLDAAINPKVAAKKTSDSPVAGQANILIVPDLNSGNILYKSLEQFAGFTCAGPIIQGFTTPLADLSRGSTIEDVILTIKVMLKLCLEESVGGHDRDRKGASPITTGASDPVSEKHNLSIT
jgi:phosphotransacetylase